MVKTRADPHALPGVLLRVLLQFYSVLVPLWASKADAGAQIDFGIDFWLILNDLWSIFNGFLIDAAFF